MSSIDDAAAGVLGVPPPVSMALGDEGAGILGVTASAAAVLAAARTVGALREAPVAGPGSAGPVPVPATDRRRRPRRRIPSAAGGPQVRIERYGGAATPGLGGLHRRHGRVEPGRRRAEPWDLTSNLTAVADQGAGSYRAVGRRCGRPASVPPTR